MASLTGITPPSNLDGVNLTPFLNGEKNESPHETLFFNTTKHGAIRQGQWKLVLVANGPSALFNLEKDAEEKHDLASVEPARVKLLEESWQTWRVQMPPPAIKSK